MITIKKNRHPLLSEQFIPQGFQEMVESFFSDKNIDPHESSVHFRPRAEILEHDKEYVIRIELQGVEKGNVAIELKDHFLTVTGKREDKRETNAIKMSEFTYGNFKRSFQLSDEVENESIKASFEDGILSIQLPKKEAKKPLQIEIG